MANCWWGAGGGHTNSSFMMVAAPGAASTSAAHLSSSSVEIAHCLGFDHCIEYNCLMNATCNLKEDFIASYLFCPAESSKLRERCDANNVMWGVCAVGCF